MRRAANGRFRQGGSRLDARLDLERALRVLTRAELRALATVARQLAAGRRSSDGARTVPPQTEGREGLSDEKKVPRADRKDRDSGALTVD